MLAIDIETIVDEEQFKNLPPVEVKSGNTKDPQKLKAKGDEAAKKRRAEAGLNPHCNLICVFGWCDHDMNSGRVVLEDDTAAGEKHLLEQAWEIMAAQGTGPGLVTFNGFAFDVPIIKLHSLFHRIRPAVSIDNRKYQVGNHLDLRMVLGNWDPYAPGKLDYYLKRLLGRGKPETIDGSLVQDYWDDGQKDKIADYCEGDARDVMELYQVVKAFFL